MNETVSEVTLVYRNWNRESGLTERNQPHPTLDSLFKACLTAGDEELIDRVIIKGRDAEGKEQTVTFVFQSVTVSR
jgi:hypothetical protein